MDSRRDVLELLPNDKQTAIRTKLKRNLAGLRDFYSNNGIPVNAGVVIGGSTCSILHYLAAHGHHTELEFFLNRLAAASPNTQLSEVNVSSSEKKTPLHLAICAGQLACIKVLVKFGGNIWVRAKVENGFKQYMSAIDLAHISGNFQVESYLRKVEKEQEAVILRARKKLLLLCVWEHERFSTLPKSIIRLAVGFF